MTGKICIFLAFIFMVLSVGLAQAQNCDFTYELIFNMRDGRVGSYNVWDSIYGGEDTEERFAAALPLPGNHNIAAGFLFERPGAVGQVLLVDLDHRAREVWQKTHQIDGLEEIIAMFPHEKGYVIFGNKYDSKKRRAVWMGVFDKEGAMVEQRDVKSPQEDLTLQDIVPAHGGRGYMMVATVEKKGEVTHGGLFALNSKGQILWDRGYLPGTQNNLLGISPMGEQGYLVTGEIETADGRNAGWVLRLNDDGSISWQQQYVRGLGSQLETGHEYNERFAVVAGSADPADKGYKAGWVMMLDANNGEIAWQRYYTGSYIYAARDILISEDGLISVMLDGDKDMQAMEEEENGEGDDLFENSVFTAGEAANHDYMSLLTIDPRGILMISDAFYNGKGADASQIYFGPRGERIMVGHTHMEYQIEAVADQEAMVKQSVEGWLVAAEETDPYTDPCVR